MKYGLLWEVRQRISHLSLCLGVEEDEDYFQEEMAFDQVLTTPAEQEDKGLHMQSMLYLKGSLYKGEGWRERGREAEWRERDGGGLLICQEFSIKAAVLRRKTDRCSWR